MTPDPGFTWSVVAGIVVLGMTAVGALVRFLLVRFLGNIERDISGINTKLAEVVEEKNRAHSKMWDQIGELKDAVAALRLAQAQLVTLDHLAKFTERIESLARDVHALKGRRK